MKETLNKIALMALNFLEQFRKYRTEWVEDLPEHITKNTIYIIGGRKYPFYAVVTCPRKKCKKLPHLEISHKFEKRWKVTETKQGVLSLNPSIYITDSSCKCHYWVKKGHIVWHSMLPLIVPRENKDI